MKIISYLGILIFSLLSTTAFAADTTWVGELYNIAPNKPSVTEEYCKSHSLDTYKTTPQDQLEEVTAKNGVTAKDMGPIKSKQLGGIYYYGAEVMFSGTKDGKEWQEKAYFFFNAVTKDGPMQGVWSTEKCKGFYKSGPA